MKRIYFCATCGCLHPEYTAWIAYNDPDAKSTGDRPLDSSYCPRCEDECSVEEAYLVDGRWCVEQFCGGGCNPISLVEKRYESLRHAIRDNRAVRK